MYNLFATSALFASFNSTWLLSTPKTQKISQWSGAFLKLWAENGINSHFEELEEPDFHNVIKTLEHCWIKCWTRWRLYWKIKMIRQSKYKPFITKPLSFQFALAQYTALLYNIISIRIFKCLFCLINLKRIGNIRCTIILNVSKLDVIR